MKVERRVSRVLKVGGVRVRVKKEERKRTRTRRGKRIGLGWVLGVRSSGGVGRRMDRACRRQRRMKVIERETKKSESRTMVLETIDTSFWFLFDTLAVQSRLVVFLVAIAACLLCETRY